MPPLLIREILLVRYWSFRTLGTEVDTCWFSWLGWWHEVLRIVVSSFQRLILFLLRTIATRLLPWLDHGEVKIAQGTAPIIILLLQITTILLIAFETVTISWVVLVLSIQRRHLLHRFTICSDFIIIVNYYSLMWFINIFMLPFPFLFLLLYNDFLLLTGD